MSIYKNRLKISQHILRPDFTGWIQTFFNRPEQEGTCLSLLKRFHKGIIKVQQYKNKVMDYAFHGHWYSLLKIVLTNSIQ